MKRPHRQLSLKECYEILNVGKGVTLEEVKHAYRRRAFELHPDLNPNNPDASRQFQLLNEAYVALTAILESSTSNSSPKDSATKGKEEPKDNAQKTASGEKHSAGNATSATNNGNTQRRTTTKGYREEDVLRDLLQDPFARRVFEDIYSELHKQQTASNSSASSAQRDNATSDTTAKRPQAARAQKPIHDTTKLHQGNLAWDTPNWNSNLNKGVTGAVKGWLRRQIDEEQSLTMPKAGLVPGQRIRLQIRQGFQGGLKTVEITLPADFAPGKAVRLKGLGKRVGPWQGDLYLTLRGE